MGVSHGVDIPVLLQGELYEYGIHFLDPTRIFANNGEAETIEWMYREGKRFHVTEEEPDGGTPSYKQIYLPKRSNSDSETDDDDDLSAVRKEMCGEWEFDDMEGEPSKDLSFSRMLADSRREEEVEERKQKAKRGGLTPPEPWC